MQYISSASGCATPLFQTGNAWQSRACKRSPPSTNASAKLRGYWTKVHENFIECIEGSSAVLTIASMLRCYPLWNASAQKKGGYADFRRIAPKIGYHSNIHWAIVKARSDWSYRPRTYLSSKFGEDPSSIFFTSYSRTAFTDYCLLLDRFFFRFLYFFKFSLIFRFWAVR